MYRKKLKTDRLLDDEEQRNQLSVKRRIPVKGEWLNDNLSIIRLNSTYLETVDKYYYLRGESISFFLPALIFILISGSYMITFSDSGNIVSAITIILVIFIALVMLTYVILNDSFNYTHYPIRFNRKNKKIYIFLKNKHYIELPWDKLFFTLRTYRPSAISPKEYCIQGHLLAEDGKTVLSSVEFGVSALAKADVLAYWEFIRRYMEEGADKVAPVVEFCLPIAEKRGSVWYELHYPFGYNFEHRTRYLLYVLSPLTFCLCLGRLFALFTSCRPQWSAEINLACQIDKKDSVNLDSAINLPWNWKDGWTRNHWWQRMGENSDYGVYD